VRGASAASSSGPSYTSSSVDASGEGDLIVTAVEMYSSDGTWSPTSPTLGAAETNAPSSMDDVAIQYRIASGAGPSSTSGSWQGSWTNWIAVTAAYRPTTGSCM